MRARRLTSLSPVEGVNVTPMIDVIMCLIIFFLIVGKLAHDRALGLRLPETRIGQGDSARADVVISIIPAREGQPGAAPWSSALVPGSSPAPPQPPAPAPAPAQEAPLFARVLVQDLVVADPASLESAIRSALGTRAPGAAVVHVRADRDVPFGLVDPVLKACRTLGISSVLLVTERRS